MLLVDFVKQTRKYLRLITWWNALSSKYLQIDDVYEKFWNLDENTNEFSLFVFFHIFNNDSFNIIEK